MALTVQSDGETADAADVNQIISLLNGTAGYGQAVKLTQLNDSLEYALDVQNVDSSNGLGLRIRDAAGLVIGTFAKAAVQVEKVFNIVLGTLSAAANMLSMSATWTGGLTYKGILMSITNTSSHANSRLIDLQVGGSSVFGIDTSGVLTTASVGTTGLVAEGVTAAKLLDGTSTVTSSSCAATACGGTPTYDNVITMSYTAPKTGGKIIAYASAAMNNDYLAWIKVATSTGGTTTAKPLNGSANYPCTATAILTVAGSTSAKTLYVQAAGSSSGAQINADLVAWWVP